MTDLTNLTTEQIDVRAAQGLPVQRFWLQGYRTLTLSLAGLLAVLAFAGLILWLRPEVMTSELAWGVLGCFAAIVTGNGWAHNFGKGREGRAASGAG